MQPDGGGGQPHGLGVCRTGQEPLVDGESPLEEHFWGHRELEGSPGSVGSCVVVTDGNQTETRSSSTFS